MGIRKRLWNWCPKPKKPVSTHFIRLATPSYIAILIVGLLLTACITMVSLSPKLFSLKSSADETEGWVPKELERISFPGGDIVVTQMRHNPFEKGYISISIEAHITSLENLSAYMKSRTKALNAFLDSISSDSLVQVAAITLRTPMKPEELVSICETSLAKLGEYAVIITDETTGTKEAGVLWFPRPQDPSFVQNLTSIKECCRLEGIIAVECYIRANIARTLQSDPRILLIDPIEDLTIFEIRKKYESMGFHVQVERALSQEMWSQYVKLEQVPN